MTWEAPLEPCILCILGNCSHFDLRVCLGRTCSAIRLSQGQGETNNSSTCTLNSSKWVPTHKVEFLLLLEKASIVTDNLDSHYGLSCVTACCVMYRAWERRELCLYFDCVYMYAHRWQPFIHIWMILRRIHFKTSHCSTTRVNNGKAKS